jgi:hypothetical protein
MKKHYIEFLSPGTFVSESTQKEIDSWDIEKAKKMAKSIKERHGATPYGFRFITRERKEGDFDSKETKRSGIYFLGGKILTLKDIKKRNDPKDSILISNMECNGYNEVIENTNSYRSTFPFKRNDVILQYP